MYRIFYTCIDICLRHVFRWFFGTCKVTDTNAVLSVNREFRNPVPTYLKSLTVVFDLLYFLLLLSEGISRRLPLDL